MRRKHTQITPASQRNVQFKVALEAVKAQRTINEIGTELYEQIGRLKMEEERHKKAAV